MTDLEKLEGYHNLVAALDELKEIQEAYERGEEDIIKGEGCKAVRISIRYLLAQRSHNLERWLKLFKQPEFKEIKEKIRAKVKELESAIGEQDKKNGNRTTGIDR